MIGVRSDAGGRSESRAYVVDSSASKGRAVRSESTLFSVGDNLASFALVAVGRTGAQWAREGRVQDQKWYSRDAWVLATVN